MKLYGSMIRLRPEKYEEYKRLHAAAWPEILAKITECGIRNYSIYHKDGFLFSYFDADMALIAADPRMQEWWASCKPCQESPILNWAQLAKKAFQRKPASGLRKSTKL
jgi:L-rhamnose mutarotase